MSMRFSDWTYWRQRAEDDPRFRRGMKKNVTEHYFKEIKQSVRDGDNNCGFCWGTKNSGKSEAVLAIALYELYEKARLEGEVVDIILRETVFGLKYTLQTNTGRKFTLFVNFNLDATLKVAMESKEGDIIIQDEVTELMGLLSETAKKKLFNILSTVRVTMVSFYFVHTEELKITGVNFYLETAVKDKENRQTYLMLYNKKQKPAGMIIVPLHEIDRLRTLYEKKKKQFAFGLLAEGGRQYILPDLEEDARKVVDYVAEKRIETPSLSLLSDIAIELNIPTEANYYKRVARKARLIIAEEGTHIVEVVDKYQGQTENLRAAILDQLTQYTKKENVDIFEEWIEGERQRDIAARKEVSQSTVSAVIVDIREKYLGYAFEDIYAKILGGGWKHGGKNTDEPDFIQEEQKKVISAKCYADKSKTVTIPLLKLGKKELQLRAEGWELVLVFYNVCWDQFFTVTVTGEEERFTFKKQLTAILNPPS